MVIVYVHFINDDLDIDEFLLLFYFNIFIY